uniref:Translation initiation factor eIF2B subunit epsilon n=1 Tax=Mycena chlorophos TaxID=658473 RepID=A0ABQ0L7T4_MYCCL|nr:translation initiation factor eIF-2B subunit epsilon [Mycena chlorophos]
MAPKAAAAKEKLIDDEEEVLQAVILADSFDKRFRPLTTNTPRCLLPICNAPLLDWTFESLALAGVQEIFVVCRSHAPKVEQAIRDSKWSRPGSGIKIVPILTAKETFSAGDAIRDVFIREIITNDFVLVMGDLVSNIRIDDVVRVHKERRKTNKDAIMTMVVKESGENHRTRTIGDSSVFVLDAATSECLHYQHVTGHPATRKTRIPREVLEGHPEIEIRNDLIDCSIDVCAVEVLSLFQDNFDWSDLRKDFVHGVLTSDLLMKNIHCYVAQHGYAARVKDTKSYDSISKDILSRWTFPLVPDDNHPGGHIYQHSRGNKYVAAQVSLARTSKIGNNTLIADGTKILDDAQVLGSVIGRNCVIGSGSIIEGAYVFDGTVIGAGCVVRRSIIGAGVTVKDQTTIERGCIVGDGVAVGPSAAVLPFERLSKRRGAASQKSEGEEEDSDIEDIEANSPGDSGSALGKQSNAVIWPQGPAEDDDDDAIAEHRNLRLRRIADTGSDLEFSDDDESAPISDDESDSDEDASDDDMLASSENDGYDDMEPQTPIIPGTSNMMQEEEFQSEVKQSLQRAFSEGHTVDNAAVELKTLRMASNVPLERVREAVIAEIVEAIPIVSTGAAAQRKAISGIVGRWGQLVNTIGGVDAIQTLEALQMHCAASDRFPLFVQILAEFYQRDIVDFDDLQTWHASAAAKGEGLPAGPVAENVKRCWAVAAQLIQHLDESDEEEESEEEESSKPPEPTPTKQESEEEEEDDESEEESDESEEEHAQAATKTASAVRTAVVTPESDESSEEEDEAQPSRDATKDVAQSESEEEESDSEDDDEHDSTQVVAKVVTQQPEVSGPTAVKAVPVPPSKADSAPPASAAVPVKAPSPSRPTLPAKPPPNIAESESSEEEEEDEDENDDEEEEESEEDESADEHPQKSQPAAVPRPNIPATKAPPVQSSSGAVPTPVTKKPPAVSLSPSGAKPKQESESEEEESDGSEESEDEASESE